MCKVFRWIWRVDEDGSRRRSTCDITDPSAAGSLAADFNKIAGVRSSGSFRRSLFRRRRHRRSDQHEAVSGNGGVSGSGQMRPSCSDASINSMSSGLTADGETYSDLCAFFSEWHVCNWLSLLEMRFLTCVYLFTYLFIHRRTHRFNRVLKY